ncbi:hypothetical protein I546_0703 [Mycobacterium kansasii 732]|nr:hypothetical protein I546_0703 [Mycobacterium kansasii 732]
MMRSVVGPLRWFAVGTGESGALFAVGEHVKSVVRQSLSARVCVRGRR